MKTKKIKFAGPSKKMAEALENEGLHVEWPKTVKDESDLAVEGTFLTGCNWEKLVTIDFRHTVGIESKSGVDNAIAYELREAYENFNIDEEMQLNLQGSASEREARGVPDAARLLEDMQEQEKCLKRFAEVADAVASGIPIPSKSDEAEITIRGKDAKKIVELLDNLRSLIKANTGDDMPAADCMIDMLRNKIKEG